MIMDWLLYEKQAFDDGFKVVCGIDEAGRGPLAGDVYAAAVVLLPDTLIEGLNDSKKLSEKKREKLFDVITDVAVSYSVGIATVEEIDELNILQATFLAMRRAVENLSVSPDFALIDGNQKPHLSVEERTVGKKDIEALTEYVNSL